MTQTATKPAIQRCTLSDEQLQAHAANWCRVATCRNGSDAVQQTAAGLAAAIEELLSFRAAEREGQL